MRRRGYEPRPATWSEREGKTGKRRACASHGNSLLRRDCEYHWRCWALARPNYVRRQDGRDFIFHWHPKRASDDLYIIQLFTNPRKKMNLSCRTPPIEIERILKVIEKKNQPNRNDDTYLSIFNSHFIVAQILALISPQAVHTMRF